MADVNTFCWNELATIDVLLLSPALLARTRSLVSI
jgi:hypothetical protein